jgi:NADH-quinone oxidoreductase subunit L
MFGDVRDFLLWIPLLPLLGAALSAFLGPRHLREQSHWPCVVGSIGACLLAFLVLFRVIGSGEGAPDFTHYYTWFQAGRPPVNGMMVDPGFISIGLSLQADGLTALMLCTVTFVGSLIVIYSIGYMHGDPGYARFFAEIALFLFSMTGLVLADNFILLYAFWEGVGLCSYLLIGFWFTHPPAAAAARKAFLVTRIGDVGLFIGILLLWLNVRNYPGLYSFERVQGGWNLFEPLSYRAVFAWATDPATDSTTLTIVCLLLFSGAVGKSAQFPLYVWLPDAMEGPTPVSALIHAATMVTAGVYLVARCTPLFALAPVAQLVVAIIGGGTAMLAALIALTQTDLKKVLAYSTISQLGYMFLGLGSAVLLGLPAELRELPPATSAELVREHGLILLGVPAAIFHLFTHAFFKALLFLGAGSVMHAMGHVIDMRRFGGLRRLMPQTHWTFLCGAAALAGLPPLAGFWSKDEILHTVWRAAGEGSLAPAVYMVLLIVGLITAGLTAFYTFRAYFLTFWGEEKIPPEAGHHAHESPLVMTVPLMILAVGAVFAGMVFGFPAHPLIENLLHHRWMAEAFESLMPRYEETFGMNLLLMLISTIIAVAGVGAAWWLYVKQPALPSEIARHTAALYQASRQRFFVDEIYNALIVRPLAGFAWFCRQFDHVLIDQLVDLVGRLPSYLGRLLTPLQNGLVQFYALLMILGLVGFLLSVLLQ